MCSPVVETFSDRVAFRILQNISGRAPLQKQPTALTLISLCQAFSNWHLSSFLSVPCFAFFSPYMNLFCTFVCLTIYKFVNIFLQKFRSSRLEVFCRKGGLREQLWGLLLKSLLHNRETSHFDMYLLNFTYTCHFFTCLFAEVLP